MNFHILCLSNEPFGKRQRVWQEEVATFPESHRAHALDNRIKTNLLFAFVMFARKMLCVVFFLPGLCQLYSPRKFMCVRASIVCSPFHVRRFESFRPFQLFSCALLNIRNLYVRRSLCSRRKDFQSFSLPPNKKITNTSSSRAHKGTYFFHVSQCFYMLRWRKSSIE